MPSAARSRRLDLGVALQNFFKVCQWLRHKLVVLDLPVGLECRGENRPKLFFSISSSIEPHDIVVLIQCCGWGYKRTTGGRSGVG